MRPSRRARLGIMCAVASMLLGISSPVLAQSQPSGNANCKLTYSVVKNDSWSRIAGKVKVTMKSLLLINKAKSSTFLQIGDVICLPKDAVVASATPAGLKLAAPTTIYTAAQSEAIIREVFPDNLEATAVAIAKRESHLNAADWNSCCVGLFAINYVAHQKWLTSIGIKSAHELLDARVNAQTAYTLYKRSDGWGAWE